MAKLQFKSYNAGQVSLFPCRLDENISVDSPVRLIDHIVDHLDLSELISTYSSGGTPPYHPRMLLKVVFYAYMNNIYSCRKISDLLDYHIHYMWLSGNQSPSYSTINRFRSAHMKDCINHLFIQVVLLLVRMGQVSLDVQYVDGTKIESVANKYTFVWRKSTETNKKKLESKIQNILSQIDAGIAQDNLPDEESACVAIDSATLDSLIKDINAENRSVVAQSREEKKELKRRSKALKELETHSARLKEYEDKLGVMGNRNSFSKTDPDATFMRMKEDAMNNGQTKPGYNVQIGTENQYITNFGLYWNPGDTTTLGSFLTLGYARFGKLPDSLCADSGYGSEQNYELLERLGIQAYVKYNWFHKEEHASFKKNPFLIENLYYNPIDNYYVCPMGQHMVYIGKKTRVSDNGYKSTVHRYQAQHCQGCPLKGGCTKAQGNRIIEVNYKLAAYKSKAKELLTADKGMEHRSKRPIEPEAVFGQMKFNKQYKRFRHRGLEKVQMDFAIFVMAFNLQKLIRRSAGKLAKKNYATKYASKLSNKTKIKMKIINSQKYYKIQEAVKKAA